MKTTKTTVIGGGLCGLYAACYLAKKGVQVPLIEKNETLGGRARAFSEKGFSLMVVPSLVRKEGLYGSGYLPQGEDDLYKTQDADYLAGTGEVATMSYYSDEVIDAKQCPMKMLAF